MIQTQNAHIQFADYFKNSRLFPYFYLLSKKLSEGSICLNLNDINWAEHQREESILSYYELLPEEKLKENELVSDGSIIKPLILLNHRLYLQRYYQYETSILNEILSLSSKENVEKNQMDLLEIQNIARAAFKENPTQKTDWQAVAALSAVLNRFTIITGGPGTGKTTTLAKILFLLYKIQPEIKVALAAPTGKAAQRMSESLKKSATQFSEIKTKFEDLQPSTLHRLLGFVKNSIHFKHNAQNPLNFDLIIVDESSMIDLALFSKLLEAIGPQTRLILLGDKNQLASVEAGSLFGDLCMAQTDLNQFSKERVNFINSFLSSPFSKIKESNTAHSSHPLFENVIELRHSFRFDDKSGIGVFSKAIIENNEDTVRSFFENQDKQVLIDTEYSNEVFNDFAKNYEAYTIEKDIRKALQKFNNQRILCAIREGSQGVYALNRAVEKYLHNKGKLSLGSEFYENRPVMITSNNYELGLFNGDIGIVREGRVWFETKDNEQGIRSILPAFIENGETVFAMSVHKSQGSEFEKVLTVLPEKENIGILTSELLYTAVTRAKESVILQGKKEIILDSINKKVERSSGIMNRFIR